MLEIPEGDHEIAGDQIVVLACGMGARHFVSRDTGHPLVAGFEPTDFRFWYDPDEDRPSPLLRTTFDAHGWTPILTAGNGGWSGEWRPMLAAAEKIIGKGRVRICQVSLAGRTVNPVAESFALRMIGAAEPYSTLSVLRDNCPEADLITRPTPPPSPSGTEGEGGGVPRGGKQDHDGRSGKQVQDLPLVASDTSPVWALVDCPGFAVLAARDT